MHTFFAKYPLTDAEIIAVKMVQDQVECAKKSLEEEPTNPKFMHALARAYDMIQIILVEKGYNPAQHGQI